MTQFDWQHYLENKLTPEEKLRHDQELAQNDQARELLDQYREAENLLKIAQPATRFLCPAIEVLAESLYSKKQPDLSFLAHIGSCPACKEELEEISHFQKSLKHEGSSLAILDPVIERGKALLRKLKEGLHPEIMSLQPAFSIETGEPRLPVISVDALDEGIEIFIEDDHLRISTRPNSKMELTILITSEHGEQSKLIQPGMQEKIRLTGVWHIQIQQAPYSSGPTRSEETNT